MVPDVFIVQYRYTDSSTGTAYYMVNTEDWNGGEYADSVYGYVNIEDVDFVVVTLTDNEGRRAVSQAYRL